MPILGRITAFMRDASQTYGRPQSFGLYSSPGAAFSQRIGAPSGTKAFECILLKPINDLIFMAKTNMVFVYVFLQILTMLLLRLCHSVSDPGGWCCCHLLGPEQGL